MCGLAGFIVRNRAALTPQRRDELTDALLRAIDHRGGDATGLLALSDEGAPWLMKASCRADAFAKGRPNLPGGTWAVIGHTRLATQGDAAFPFNNHPIRVGETYITHNGHVSNDREIIRNTRGVFQQVDSAAIAAALDHTDWEHPSIRAALESLEGSAAVVAAAPKRMGERLLLARVYSSPLYVWRGKSATVWASTPEAIQRAWRWAVGAPPSIGSMEKVPEGVAYLIGRDGSEDRLTFEPKGSRYSYSAVGSSYWTGGDWKPSPAVGKAIGGTAASRADATIAAKAKAIAAKASKGKSKSKPKRSGKRSASLGRERGSAAPTAALRPITAATDPDDYIDTCDGCGDAHAWHYLEDMGVGFFCRLCIDQAETTGYLPGFSDRYAGAGA